MIRRIAISVLVLLGWLILQPAYAEEQGAYIVHDTTLMSEPFSDAKALRNLAAHTQVTAIERDGGWYKIKLGDSTTGWVRMFHLRLGAEGSGGSDSGLASTLRFLETGRSGSSGVTVATGIRGLDAADVSNAQPNREALETVNTFGVSKRLARNFADSAALKAQQLAYFPAPDDNTEKPAPKDNPASPWSNEGSPW